MSLALALVCEARLAPAAPLAAEGNSGGGGAAAVNFNRDVRPLLSENCFACHGPDEGQRKAGLRLDRRDDALKVLKGGDRAIVPGDVAHSELVRRLTTDDEDDRMPPVKTGKRLSPQQVAVLRRWVEQGAAFQGLWSLTPPAKPAPPGVSEAGLCRNEIDRFVLAKLEREGLSPAPEADRPTLARRLSLDLLGLPPTPAEVDAFVNDASPDAYEKLVDRLLANPHYGERMALDWLDAARYADTHGYHIDSGRDMTRWRDWVINAFNANKPFDQFAVEQLAGDLLPHASPREKAEHLIASGFHRNHMVNFEGGAVPEEYLNAYRVDVVSTTATVFLGLTMNCCQCHDHKFDPISQKEFYQFYAFFNNTPESGLDGSKGNAAPVARFATPEQQGELDRLAAAIEAMEAKKAAAKGSAAGALNAAATARGDAPADAKADAAQAEWERAAATARGATPTEWLPLDPAEPTSAGGAQFTRQADGSLLVTGPNPATDTYTLTCALPPDFAARAGLKELTALRLEVLPAPGLGGGGPGRSPNGNFVLTGARLAIDGKPAPLKAASADFSQENFPVAAAIDDSRPNPAGTGWAIYPAAGRPHDAVFELAAPARAAAGTTLRLTLEFQSHFAQHQPGRLRLSATGSRFPHARGGPPAPVAAALATPADQRSAKQKAELRVYFRANVYAGTHAAANLGNGPDQDPAGKAIDAEIARLKKQRDQIEKAIPSTMVMQETPRPRDTFVLLRGMYDRKGEKVSADVPACLPPLPPGAPRDRLALARWVISPQNPLTARVTVNRFWQSFFGTGLVKTAEDFGTQGEYPSHPQLLDWLASHFVESGWDVKAMTKLIVTSATYRQSSAAPRERMARDPENRLLSRGPRVRLPAEIIRDQALAAAGLLDGRIGGSSVSPYQPPGIWEELASRSDGANWTAQSYTQSHGPDLYRRGMYTFWKRSAPPPTMLTFDAPSRETCTVRRLRTNTPLQALVLMNDPTYVEAARKLAERMMHETAPVGDPAHAATSTATTAARITYAFRLTLARPPREKELTVLQSVHDAQLAAYRQNPEAAHKLLAVGESPRDEKLDAAELAANAMVASCILNLDEAVTKQ